MLTIYCVLACMSVMHDALGGSHSLLRIYPAWPLTQAQTIGSLTLKRWKCNMEKNHFSSGLIGDRSWDPRVSGRVLWGLVTPVPVVITSLLLSLSSILTIYCVLPCMSVMHDVLLGIPCPDGWLVT